MRSVANLTRRDGEEMLALAPECRVRTHVSTYPLAACRRRARGPPGRRLHRRGGDPPVVRPGPPAVPPRRLTRPALDAVARQQQLHARAALGRCAADAVPPWAIGDRAHDREPQAGASGGAVAGGVDAVEAIEDALALGRRDPRAVVVDEEADPAALLGAHRQPHQPAPRARCGRSRCRSGCEAPGRGGRGPRRASPAAAVRARSGGPRAGSSRPTAPPRSPASSIGSGRRKARSGRSWRAAAGRRPAG